MDRLESWLFQAIFVFGGGELCYEICQGLGFYGSPWSILYVELFELDGLLYHSLCSLGFIHCFLNGLIHHDYYRVCLKVQMKFSGHHY